MFLAKLTKKERKLIRKIAKLQLDALNCLLNGETEHDILLYAIYNDLEEEALRKAIRYNIEEFERVLEKPGYITSLDQDNISIVKTVLFKFYDLPKYKKEKRKIWKKLNVCKFYQGINPN